MSSVSLTDGRVLHVPGAPFILDATSVIIAPAAGDLAAVVPLIRYDQLLLFAKRLVDGARKRRFSERHREVNRAKLELARMCIERALSEGQKAPADEHG